MAARRRERGALHEARITRIHLYRTAAATAAAARVGPRDPLTPQGEPLSNATMISQPHLLCIAERYQI